MNKLTKFKEHVNESILIDESDYFIVNILISYFASILLFLVGQLLIIPAIILWILELIFRKVSFKRKVNVNKVMLSWQNKLLVDVKYNLKLNNPFDKINRIDNDFIIDPNMSLKTFITKFIIYYNDNYDTYCVSGNYWNFICDTSKRRSLEDIFLICRNYYSTCTTVDVLKALINLIEEKRISGSRCNTINKFVFYNQRGNSDLTGKVEYGTELTFKELIEYYKTN